MPQFNHTVSAIVPCYNSEMTIERCLNSILGQSYPVSEILVYDDCSTDRSSAVLSRLKSKHPNIRIFTGAVNKGAGHARSTLLKAAKSTHLAFIDADDVWHPTKIEVQLELLHQHNADIAVCDYEIVNAEGLKLGVRRLPRAITRFKMHLQDEIPTSMALLRRDLEGCRSMPMLRRRQDYAYWLSLFALNSDLKCVSTPEVLGTYYRMPNSLSSSMTTNLVANYKMFRDTQEYSVVLSCICVFANVTMRIVRRLQK